MEGSSASQPKIQRWKNPCCLPLERRMHDEWFLVFLSVLLDGLQQCRLHLAFYDNRSKHRCSLHSTRFRRFSAREGMFHFLAARKLGLAQHWWKERGGGGEARKGDATRKPHLSARKLGLAEHWWKERGGGGEARKGDAYPQTPLSQRGKSGLVSSENLFKASQRKDPYGTILSLQASSPGRSGGGAGKGRRACNSVSGIWISAWKKRCKMLIGGDLIW